MPSDPRRAALDILLQIESAPVTLDQLMEGLHADGMLAARDMRFVHALVYGVQRWRYRLDAAIAAMSAKAPRKRDPRVGNILRMGLYQIMAMDRVPESAAVHSAVELARKVECPWAGGYINAVLRRALREPRLLEAPPAGDDPVRQLAVSQSFPEWMIRRWIQRYGWEATTTLCRATNRIPPLVLRTNRLRTRRAQLQAALTPIAPEIRPSVYTPEGLCIDRLAGRLFDSQPFLDGWFQIQDEAAQAVGHLVDARPGEHILDACAGLGGKTAHLAERMQNQGRITATDRDGRKLDRLVVEMQRLGIRIVETATADWTAPADSATADRYDKILLDAPCSGMGVLRRNPDAKWKRRPKAFQRYRATQRKLLANLAPRVKSAGALVYAVCSTEPEETRQVTEWFLKNHPQFAIDRQPGALTPTMAPLLTADGCLQTEVHRHDTDGFFAVRLIRQP